MECLNCHIGHMQPPRSQHPAYVECPNCGAIELTYEPMDYQTQLHETEYIVNKNNQIQPQIIGIFGG
jgi:Zn ribbon nucleic-acid-binding protein